MSRYHPYYEWEDWKAGMYATECENEEKLILECLNLLKNPEALFDAMRYVAFEWTKAADQNMSNPSLNHQSWLGQAACCFEAGAPEYVTRKAWGLLLQSEKDSANIVADKVYMEWTGDMFC